MFRRYPYWGWLTLSLILWCINGYQFHMHRQAMLPERMAHAVNKDLQRREDAFQDFVKNQPLVDRLFERALADQESEQVNGFPFYVFCYDHGVIKAWNKRF